MFGCEEIRKIPRDEEDLQGGKTFHKLEANKGKRTPPKRRELTNTHLKVVLSWEQNHL